MCLSKHLLKLWDEFYLEISEQERKKNKPLALSFETTRSFIEESTDVFDDEEELMLIREISSDLQKLEANVSDSEKSNNPKMVRLLDEFKEHVHCLEAERNDGEYGGYGDQEDEYGDDEGEEYEWDCCEDGEDEEEDDQW
ncbi:MAG: hypothetical protein P4M08_13875 [Oligoflexia bacterium]|nr:hypothetical protein [Oligoflexia bacterium]